MGKEGQHFPNVTFAALVLVECISIWETLIQVNILTEQYSSGYSIALETKEPHLQTFNLKTCYPFLDPRYSYSY